MKINFSRLKTILPLWLMGAMAVGAFLYGTSPDEIGPQGITVFFIVAYGFCALSIQLLVLTVVRLLSRPGKLKNWRFSYALIAAFLPVTVAGLGTLDQLVLRDILIFAALVALVIFYVAKQSQK